MSISSNKTSINLQFLLLDLLPTMVAPQCKVEDNTYSHINKHDARAYCEDPEDVDDYNNRKLGFVVGDMRDEIEQLVGENGALEGIYSKIVPNEVDDGTFWFRYFYKVHKLKQQEEMRARLVKRSLSVDDDDDEEEFSFFNPPTIFHLHSQFSSNLASDQPQVTRFDQFSVNPFDPLQFLS
ncbi:hypothetical protein L1987_58937 [Smallanthus sonchifolius]|uniref:Uncharacterized protein n=1 Tax=Smallanthus sonchifolius TaxID=185202 RepID=A0ACB9D4F4_9ASTR|nr:hypothetical protein L1987_58937 [Smallanthus sonchifolius]